MLNTIHLIKNTGVYIRAQGDGTFEIRNFLSYLRLWLFQIAKRNKMYINSNISIDKCFDVTNERYAYLLMLKRVDLIGIGENWIFCKTSNKNYTKIICWFLNLLKIKDSGILLRFVPIGKTGVHLWRNEKIESIVKKIRYIFLDGTTDRCHIWLTLLQCIKPLGNFTIINYPVYWFPWNFSDVQLKYYDLYLIDEKWQQMEFLKRFGWASDECLHEMIKIPNYKSIFYSQHTKKRWDVCLPGVIREGKNQVEIIKSLFSTAKRNGRKMSCCIVGGVHPSSKKYYQKLLETVKASRDHLDVGLIPNLKRKKFSQIIQQSKIVIIGSKWESSPRILQEVLCCDVPVLVNEEMLCGKKYINARTGRIAPLEEFDTVICEMLGTLEKYSPRKFFLNNWKPKCVVKEFISKVESLKNI